MASSFLIVGLGNPGPKYAETRHNAGFWFLDGLLSGSGQHLRTQAKVQAECLRTSLFGHDCIIARPTTFMNRSGSAVRALLDYYKVPASQFLVAYDELDLPPGTARLKQGGGHGGHNGMRDIFQHVQERDFIRLRIGIGHPGHKSAVTRYVLGRSPRQVREVVESAIARAVSVLPMVLDGRLQDAMTALHSEPGS